MRSWFERRAHPIAFARRFTLALSSVALVGLLFHSWFAVGLVGRGDDLIRAGKPADALRYFKRAAWFDPGWSVPVERFGFAVTLLGERPWYEAETRIASKFLAQHPDAATVRWDRAVAYVHLGRPNQAYRDIALLARERPNDARLRSLERALAVRIGMRP